MQNRLYVLLPLVVLCVLCLISCGSNDEPASDGDFDSENSEVDGDADLDQAEDQSEIEAETEAEAEEEINYEELVFYPKNEQFSTIESHDPLNVRLGYSGDPSTSMTITWRTKMNDLEKYEPVVWVVKEEELGGNLESLPFSLKYVAKGEGLKYTTLFPEAEGEEMVDTDFVVWSVDIQGLEAGTSYYYRAGSFKEVDFENETLTEPNFSGILSFKTAVAKGTRSKVRMVAAGDSRGGAADIKEHIQQFVDIDANFWIFNGDITTNSIQTEWFEWFDALGPLLQKVPFMSVCGNHEINWAMFSSDIFYHQFAAPKIGEPLAPEFQERAWSFDYDNVHVIGLDSNAVSTIEMYLEWLEKDLKAAEEDENIDWKVVTFHQGAYSSCSKHGSTGYVQELLVPLFEKYKVDLVFNGHDHTYERSCRIMENACVEDEATHGVTYVIVGGFFAPGYSPQTDWFTKAFAHGDKRNYMVVDFEGKQLTATAYDGDGVEIDKISLDKGTK